MTSAIAQQPLGVRLGVGAALGAGATYGITRLLGDVRDHKPQRAGIAFLGVAAAAGAVALLGRKDGMAPAAGAAAGAALLTGLAIAARDVHAVIGPVRAGRLADGSELRKTMVPSAALGRDVETLVHLPAGYGPSKRYPTLYLLHGAPGNANYMERLLREDGNLARALESGALPPTIVVMPKGPKLVSRTEWTDSQLQAGEKWGTFVTRDLVDYVDSTYATSARGPERAVAGLSMGGLGSVNLSLRRPDVFGVASSWSPYLEARGAQAVGAPGSATWKAASPLQYVDDIAPQLRERAPRLSLYVGREDRFVAQNRAFDRKLDELLIPHQYREVDGGHLRGVWSRELEGELAWIGEQFRAARDGAAQATTQGRT